jgi:endonuclease G, mitochondrial
MGSVLNHILRDKEVVDQVMAQLHTDAGGSLLESTGVDSSAVKKTVESVAAGRESEIDSRYEAIIRKVGRPVLFIQDRKIQEPVLPLWKKRLAPARPLLERVLSSVGRIELRGHPRYPWVGTGWLVAPRVVVTNRHVAETFGRQSGEAFQFKLDPVGKRIRASIDFYQEHERPAESEFQVLEILHIEEEEEGRPDIAFLRLASRDQDDKELPAPIALSAEEVKRDQVVGAIGYAAWDGERNVASVMDKIFDSIYEVKRLHPGEVMNVRQHYLNHDCSTLGGNSGSAVLDFATGEAVALHYAGEYEKKNFAVKATTVREKMKELRIDPEVGV